MTKTLAAIRRWPAKRWAEIGIGIQWLALMRTLAEYFRLKYGAGEVITSSLTEHFLRGGLIAAGCLGAAAALYFAGKFRAAVGMAVITIGLLLGYKFIFMN